MVTYQIKMSDKEREIRRRKGLPTEFSFMVVGRDQA